jgi:hypothetical protein
MARDRDALSERVRAVERRERNINDQIERAQERFHDIAAYDRAAFVVYRTFGGDMNVDVEYEVPDRSRIDGCGFRLDPGQPRTADMLRRIATALAALGVDAQPGVRAEPPLGEGRRYGPRPTQPAVAVTPLPRN